MAKSYNFEPLVNLVSAVSYGSQIGAPEMLAYDYACDYYGEDRVAIQKTTKPVENARDIDARSITLDVRGMVSTEIIPLSVRDVTPMKLQWVAKNMCSCHRSLYSIFIHWPEVTISNEKDESIRIFDLFVRIPLSNKGMTFPESEKFTLMRTTYTRVQWNHGYMHSHVKTINADEPLKFRHICLGTGPLNRTIDTLTSQPQNTDAMMLFFWELDKTVHVESLAGVPYKRMSGVTGESYLKVNTIATEYTGVFKYYRTGVHRKAFGDFLSSFFLSEKIPMGFRDGQYVLGCSFLEFAVNLTNYYKKWLDANAEYGKIKQRTFYPAVPFELEEYYIMDNKIWVKSSSNNNLPVPNYVTPFKFKDREFGLNIIDTEEGKNYLRCNLIQLKIVAAILNFILTTVNTATSKPYEETNKEETDFWGEQYSTVVSEDNSAIRKRGACAKGSTSTAY